VHRACRHIAPFTHAIRVALAAHRQRHLSAQDDVRGLRSVRVIGVRCVRPILPHIRVPEAFLLESSRELPFIHSIILANRQRFRRISAPENGYALPAELGDPAERALPSSGEKTVMNYKIRRWALAAEAYQLAHPRAERREIHADDRLGRPARLPSPCNPRAR
jgi:hypothetical protein